MNMGPGRKSVLCGLLLASLAPVAELAAQEIRLGGQVRPRFEYRDPALPAAGEDAFTSMRTRLALTALLQEDVALFVQVQDVRFWGEDRILATAPGVTELHQGHITVGRILSRDIAARVGRQEMMFGAERLVGNADWTQRARAFDGVRATFGAAPTGTLDLFATRVADRTAARETDADFHGAYGSFPLVSGLTADVYGLYNRARPTPARTDQGTFGGRLGLAPRGGFMAEAEGALQFGERGERDVRAWMLRAHAGPVLLDGRARVLLSLEHYSGGPPTDERARAFDALYGTAHRFLGFADIFTNIPLHTGGRGVQELALRTTIQPEPALEIIASAHGFRAANDEGLSSARFGEEVDLRVRWRWRAPLNIVGGASHVWQGPALAEIGRLDRNMTWAYLMLNATF
jgi:hypothetical protein